MREFELHEEPGPPPLIGPAVSQETAAGVEGWADGLVTVRPRDRFERTALKISHDQWRTNVFAPPLCWDLVTVEQFDLAAAHVRPEDVKQTVVVSSELERHLEVLRELAELGFEEIYLHHVGQDLDPFIDAFGEHVLPALTGEA